MNSKIKMEILTDQQEMTLLLTKTIENGTSVSLAIAGKGDDESQGILLEDLSMNIRTHLRNILAA